jgi:dolichol-phosphate mannosyltransferase
VLPLSLHIPLSSAASVKTPLAVSVILPTRNESGNIQPLLKRLEAALAGIAAEIIFVDDSSDDTPQVIKRLGALSKLDVRLIARPPEKRTGGLGGAVVEGFRAAKGEWMCVMDADLQHPPETITQLLNQATTTNSDLVIASRFTEGASTPGLGEIRNAISHAFILSARVLFIKQLRNVTDPLTGFFMVRRSKIDVNEIRPNGFKILLEMIVQFPKLKISEIGFMMESRHAGQSKASMNEVMRYYRKLIELRFTRANPRFFQFLLVGLTGIFINNLALAFFTETFHIYYLVSAILATQISTMWNFTLTEFWVFGDRRNNRTFMRRLLGFFVINNALLALRGPMISFMVEVLKMNYIAANVISIGMATVLRYFLASRLLWKTASPGKSRAEPTVIEEVLASEANQIAQES